MFRMVFPEFNCDVVLWRRTESTLSFLENWRDLYLEHAFARPHDQGAFRWLAWHTDLRVGGGPYRRNSTTEAQAWFGTTPQSSRTGMRLTCTPADARRMRLPLIARASNRAFRRLGAGVGDHEDCATWAGLGNAPWVVSFPLPGTCRPHLTKDAITD